MCLRFGTPYRLYQALVQGAAYPDHCDDEETLRGVLKTEFEAGHYDDLTLFSPTFRTMLWVLVYRCHLIEPQKREPYYPYCDLVQGLAFVFGIFGTMPKWFPVNLQDFVAANGLRMSAQDTNPIGGMCYTSCRAIWRAAEPEFQAETRPLYQRWQKLGGVDTMLAEYAFRHPDVLRVNPYRDVPLEA